MRLVVGIGARSEATVADIEAVVAAALASLPAPVAHRHRVMLAIAAGLAACPQVEAMGRATGCRVRLVAKPDLIAAGPRCRTSSQRSRDAHGVPSVAEAAALAGAGPHSILIVRRIAHARATAAIASSDGNAP